MDRGFTDMIRKHPVAVSLIALAGLLTVALWLLRDRAATTSRPTPATTLAGSTDSGRTTASETNRSTPTRIRRLSAEERRQLGEQIRQAVRRARAPTSPGGAPADDPIIPLEQAGEVLQAGLQQAIPILAECYRKGSAAIHEAAALMTMI